MDQSITVSNEELSLLSEEDRKLFNFQVSAHKILKEAAEIMRDSVYKGSKIVTPGAIFEIIQFLDTNSNASLNEARHLAEKAKELSQSDIKEVANGED